MYNSKPNGGPRVLKYILCLPTFCYKTKHCPIELGDQGLWHLSNELEKYVHTKTVYVCLEQYSFLVIETGNHVHPRLPWILYVAEDDCKSCSFCFHLHTAGIKGWYCHTQHCKAVFFVTVGSNQDALLFVNELTKSRQWTVFSIKIKYASKPWKDLAGLEMYIK